MENGPKRIPRAPREGLFTMGDDGVLRPLNPASPGVLGNSPEIAAQVGNLPFPHRRGVVDAYIEGEADLVENGIAAGQGHWEE